MGARCWDGAGRELEPQKRMAPTRAGRVRPVVTLVVAMQAAIQARELTKRFGSRPAVEDITFDVAAGEVFGFLGPNGAGKTTTVRLFSTLVRPTAGTAE